MRNTRLTIFAGHYGSGKTSLAVNYAAHITHIKEKPSSRVILADLDIVNPYFRTVDGAAFLDKHGVELLTTEYAGSNLEAPAMPGSTSMLFDDTSITGVIDLGGDDRGALALGRYSERIAAEPDKNILLVINCYRPLSATPEAVAEYVIEIERAGGFKFTGIVNNSNLGRATTATDILAAVGYGHECSVITGLPLVLTSIRAGLGSALSAALAKPDAGAAHIGDLFEMELFQKWGL